MSAVSNLVTNCCSVVVNCSKVALSLSESGGKWVHRCFLKTLTSAALCPRPLLAYSIWALLSVWGPTVINPKYHYSISPEYGKHCDTVSLLAPGYPLHSDTFFGPKWHSPVGSMPFHRAQKVSISRAQPPPTCSRNGDARIKSIMHRAA